MKHYKTFTDEHEPNQATLIKPIFDIANKINFAMRTLTDQKHGEQSGEPLLQDTRPSRTKHLRRMKVSL